eukprot:CAMPEP_0174349486 /NCGR_PEP_ID=MMETSP0811_2-20130205/6226_1 /TAXON_ID=73025 ORGANISM="Eutreptiella gymnastica-like, Strain CCMP1594" /NCGR_SAMPLE_ID=MMETSP0811_2 /ASSEMBLY_ACC=CAM_ASM_000667 /LENGTH=63 /DNA_ID=CAMNT_0015476901 /DNA_START=249 /DNA_END=440 /DNA_ORIENTATION=+
MSLAGGGARGVTSFQRQQSEPTLGDALGRAGGGGPPPLSLSRAPSLWPSHRLTDRKCQPQWQL